MSFGRPIRNAIDRHGPTGLLLRWFLGLFLIAALSSLSQSGVAQSEIVLRDLRIHRSKVKRFDQSAVYLSNGAIVHWDQVLQATLDVSESSGDAEVARQESFDAILEARGRAVFQIRHRLSLGDWSSLAKVTEPLNRGLAALPTNSEMARQEYIISLGAVHASLHQGDRAAAVRPFLRACRLKAEFDFDSGLPTTVELSPQQIKSRLHPSIVPVFFDEKSARQQLDFIQGRLLTNQQEEIRYLVALAVCAGEQELARELLAKLGAKDENWVRIFSAQLELADGPGDAVELIRDHQWREGLTRNQATVVNYILAVAASRISSDADTATLAFLGITAANQYKDRHLAAAALYQAVSIAEKNGRTREAKILKSELLDKYPETYHGRMTEASNQQ